MKAFIKRVATMRKLQKKYQNSRDSFTLQALRKVETEVDELLKKLIHEEQPPTLF